MRVLLLNPPGDKPYLRDYYCSHSAKGYYYWHPYDLVVQSGILSRHHEVEYLDANVYTMTFQEAAREVKSINPDALVFLTGGVCWKNDFSFLQSLDIPPHIPVIGTGDVMVSRGRELMNIHPWLNAVLLDFTSDSVDVFLRAWNRKQAAPELDGVVPNLLYRSANGEFIRGVDPGKRYYSFPLPRYDLIPMHKYRIPHGRRKTFASFLTDFGCPYTCSFALMANGIINCVIWIMPCRNCVIFGNWEFPNSGSRI